LGEKDEQGVVASPGPGGLVRGGEERVGFGFGEKRHDGPVEAFLGNGEHLLDDRGVFGVQGRRVSVKRSDRCQSGVAGSGTVVPDRFEMVEERSDQDGVEVDQIEVRWGLGGVGGGVVDEQPEGVPVAGDGVRTGVSLCDEPVCEEPLEGRCERGHGSTWLAWSRRCAARSSSSGVPVKYQ